MVVNPFWFGFGIGIFGTILLEIIALVTYSIYLDVKKKKGDK